MTGTPGSVGGDGKTHGRKTAGRPVLDPTLPDASERGDLQRDVAHAAAHPHGHERRQEVDEVPPLGGGSRKHEDSHDGDAEAGDEYRPRGDLGHEA
jgi:hypothetical protein